MFKVNNKNTPFTPFSSVYIVDFKQVNVSCGIGKKRKEMVKKRN